MTLRQTLGLALALGVAGCSPAEDHALPTEPQTDIESPQTSEATEVSENVAEVAFQEPKSPQMICDERAREAQKEVRELFSHFDFRTSSMDFEPLRAAHAAKAKCLKEHGIEVPVREESSSGTAGSLTIIL